LEESICKSVADIELVPMICKELSNTTIKETSIFENGHKISTDTSETYMAANKHMKSCSCEKCKLKPI
jgi:hypothetical protein